MNKLITLDQTISLREIPDKELNRAILTELMPWLSRLLSLTDETSANRLETALPAIKEHCIGMGFLEIQKMFELYADGKLDISPISNFFDRILLGKILNSYRSYKKRISKQKKILYSMSDDEITKIDDEILNRVGLFFKENRYIDDNDFYVYDILEKRGLVNLSVDYKESVKKDAIVILKKKFSEKKSTSREDFKMTKSILKYLDNGQHIKIKIKCKQLASEDYFRSIEKTSPKD
jgi:hypothetical protein